MKIRCSAVIAAAVLVAVATSAQAAKHTADSIDKVDENLTKRKAVLVDVREDHETNKGYVDGAILVPLSLLNEGQQVDGFAQILAQRLPVNAIIYVYCQSGNRSLLASDILGKFKYDARPLRHGFKNLQAEGFVIARPKTAQVPAKTTVTR
jgi:rhodanese-related sulfurtransferase